MRIVALEKATRIIYSEVVSVFLVIQHVIRMPLIRVEAAYYDHFGTRAF